MKMHVFNPEHDLALAANLSNFTAPHAGRQLRTDLGFIPALWAQGDDVVLVENTEEAERRFRLLVHRACKRFVTKEQLGGLPISGVEVWGWDLAIRSFLIRYGVDVKILPSESEIEQIRMLSHRQFAQNVLGCLRGEGLVGEAYMTDSIAQIHEAIERYGTVVVKAPWSSSGRGVRFLNSNIKRYDEGWASRVIEKQGAIMLEPYYNKVKDFGMEFESDGRGQVSYLGLSLFHTSNGAYQGNILADEDEKQELLSRYVPADILHDIQQKITALTGSLLRDQYRGPFGVDMMVVARDDQQGFLLHPCVEINLRRTMGHVALALTPWVKGLPKVMNIEYNTNIYKMKVKRLG